MQISHPLSILVRSETFVHPLSSSLLTSLSDVISSHFQPLKTGNPRSNIRDSCFLTVFIGEYHLDFSLPQPTFPLPIYILALLFLNNSLCSFDE